MSVSQGWRRGVARLPFSLPDVSLCELDVTRGNEVPARRTAFMALTLALYATSLALPAIVAKDGNILGYNAVLWGTMWPFTIAWSANVVLLLGLILFGAPQYNLALTSGAIGLCLARTSPMVTQKSLSAFGPGFHVWWLTFVVLSIVSVVECLASKEKLSSPMSPISPIRPIRPKTPHFSRKLSSRHNSRVMRQGSGESGPRTYTFLYTDIVGSSRLWEADPTAMAAALASHNDILESAVNAAGGRVFKSLGDGLACVFDAADAAVRCAVEMQRTLVAAQLPGPIEIRIGVHSGTAHPVGNDFGGPVLNRVSRITDLAEGGQIFISEAAQSLAKDYVGLEVRFDALGEVVLEGMTRPEKVFCVRAEGLRAGETFGGDAPLPPSNLEGLERPFIGRVAERKDLAKRLRESDQRLITVVGFGGMGKTTLARQCGLDVREDFAGCAYWIECEPIRGRDELAAAALAVLGEVSETADSEESLVALIGDKRVLLIFDCFENIVTLGGFLDRLVRRCPNLKVLVTSRIVLGAEAEYLVELGGMSGKQSASVESDAVELFLSHTARHSPSFGARQTERTLVRRLVRDLEYVPLAIVICAGRLRYTSIKALHEQIQSSLLGTVKSVRDQAGRHSGLARVIQMSFDLLDEADQRVLEGLSVFEGGFTLESACAVLEPTLSGVEAAIHRLRDHSLVSTLSTERYHLLDSLREFLADQACEDFTDQIELGHSVYFLAVASRIRKLSDSHDWAIATTLWRLEAANLRKAAMDAVRNGKGAAEFARTLARVLLETGHFQDLEQLCRQAAIQARVSNDIRLEVEVLGFQGMAQRRQKQPHLAAETFLRRAELCRTIDDPVELADSLLDVAMAWLEITNLEGARVAIEEVRRLGNRAGPNRSAAVAMLGLVLAKSGNHEAARNLATEASSDLLLVKGLLRSIGRILGQLYRECGDFAVALKVGIDLLEECLDGDNIAAAGIAIQEIYEGLLGIGHIGAAARALACASLIPPRLAPSISTRTTQLVRQFNSTTSPQLLESEQRALLGKSWDTCAREFVVWLRSAKSEVQLPPIVGAT